MSSASGLFQNWRSRFRSSPSPSLRQILGEEPPSVTDDRDPDVRHRRLRPLIGRRRRQLPRPHGRRRASTLEQEPDRTNHVEANEFRTITSNSDGTSSSSRFSRSRLSTGAHLPSNVLQARARLLQRLTAASLTGSRRTTTTASDMSQDGFVFEDYFEGIDPEEWMYTGPARDWPELEILLGDMIEEANQASVFHDISRKPPGLSWEVINGLRQETFGGKAHNDAVESLLDCSICLEIFCEGDRLIHLPCGHRFHRGCLEPWVRSCGDCPYCRASVEFIAHDQ